MNTRVVLISLVLWLCALGLHLTAFVVSGVDGAGDGYDTQWQFQIVSFCITRLPFYLLVLPVVLILAFSIRLLLKKPQ